MSLILVLKDKVSKKTYFACDSYVSNSGESNCVLKKTTPKIRQISDNLCFGMTGTLNYIDEIEKILLSTYNANSSNFVRRLKKQFQEFYSDKDLIGGFELVISYKDQIWVYQDNGSFLELELDIYCSGVCTDLALGYISALLHNSKMDKKKIIEKTFSFVTSKCPYVLNPYIIKTVKHD